MLWLGNDERTLHLAPAPELERLRYHPREFDDLTLDDGGAALLSGINGESCELGLRIEPGTAQQVGLQVRTSPDGAETTLLYYDAAARSLMFDATRSGSKGRPVVEQAPLALADGEALELRVFIDRSVVEVFANDRQAITRRVFPEGEDSDLVTLWCRGGRASFSAVRSWEMMPANAW